MPMGVWGVLHGLCLKKSHNLPANLALGVEFPSHGGQKLLGAGIQYVGFGFKNLVSYIKINIGMRILVIISQF